MMVPLRESHASELDALELTTRLLQRYRQLSPTGGVWEAADFQWNWRMPRASDRVAQRFWMDESGPVAGILLTSSRNDEWQIDPVSIPGLGPDPEDLWRQTLDAIDGIHADVVDIPVRDDDDAMRTIVTNAGWVASEHDRTGWMNANTRPEIVTPTDGFTVTDRSQRSSTPHHLQSRSGSEVEARLNQCSLYDPTLDLVMETGGGDVAGYALFWLDPITHVGLVEPVRTEDAFQRKGIARALVTHGISRLVDRGATRIKVSNESDAAARLYDGLGFKAESTTTWYRKPLG